jgi:hypothetical protein
VSERRAELAGQKGMAGECGDDWGTIGRDETDDLAFFHIFLLLDWVAGGERGCIMWLQMGEGDSFNISRSLNIVDVLHGEFWWCGW